MKSDILARMMNADGDTWPEPFARSVLKLKLAQVDIDRVNALAEKARAGELSAEERHELDEYEFVGCMVDIMKSKARISVKQADAAA